MKKRLVIKKWVEKVLLIISAVALVVVASDSDSTKIFLITHLTAGIVLLGSAIVLIKYGREND